MKIAVTLKTKLKWTIPREFLTIGGYFEHNTNRITALGWLKQKKINLTMESFYWVHTSVFFHYTADMLVFNNIQWSMGKALSPSLCGNTDS